METEARRDRVDDLFAQAIELPAEAWQEFLSSACDGDASLLAEVQKLLAAHEKFEQSTEFLVSTPEDGRQLRDSLRGPFAMIDSERNGLSHVDAADLDALADEFELAFRRGQSPRIEDFLSRVGESIRPAALREFLKIEVVLRRDRGEPVSVEQYLGRFSNSDAVVLDVFRMSDDALATTAYRHGKSIGSGDTVTFAHEDSVSIAGRLQIRCPSCHRPVELAIDTALTDVHCTACGSQFSLINENDAAQLSPSLATMGRFELIARLGMGAFGTVWKARDKELDRTVAIKIPRQGGMTAEEQENFFREARAAAQLRHPNIVSVHEVGRDGDSVYIVSDFVRGVTLGDWLTGQKLTGLEAAELCAKIAEALQHAHEQGVIHRDLKPANVMIDGHGQPHLMDFGLARREAGEVTVTLDGHVLGTPAYMSPEQARGESHTADSRSDLYSLGVILFQVLTGELPFRGNVRMLLHQVIHDEPPGPRKLNSNISKDLETIALKCLEKDPPRRYQTATELAEELRRFVRGEPIQARPVSRAERAVRWVRRNKVVAALLAAVVTALIGGTVTSTMFAIDARHQAAAALAKESETSAVLGFVEGKIFAAARPQGQEGGLGKDVTLRQAMESAMPFVEGSFTDQPLIEARLRGTLGRSFMFLGDAKTAAQQHEIVHKLLSRELGAQHPVTLLYLSNLAVSYEDLGRYKEALAILEPTLALMKVKLGPDNSATLHAKNDLAGVYNAIGRQSEALKLFEETLALRKATLGLEHSDTLQSISNLAGSYFALGRFPEALQLREQAVALKKAKLGPDHPDTLVSMNNLANSYNAVGRFAEAIGLQEQTLPLMRAKLGQDHPYTMECMNGLGAGYGNLGRYSDALTIYEEMLKLRKRKLGLDHPDTLTATNNVAITYHGLGRYVEAADLHEETLALQKTTLGIDHPSTLTSMHNLANNKFALGQHPEAVKLYEETLPLQQAKLGKDHPETLQTMNNLAVAYSTVGREADAATLYEQTLPLMKAKRGPQHPYTLTTMNNLASSYEDLGRHPESLTLREALLAICKTKFGAEHIETIESMHALVSCYYAVGRYTEASTLLNETLTLRRAALGPKHAATLNTLNQLAWMLATAPTDEARDGKRAVELALEGCELTEYKVPNMTDTLAAAYAETGDFASAIKWSEQSLELLGDDGSPRLRHSVLHALAKYKAKKSMRHEVVEGSHAQSNSEQAGPSDSADSQAADAEARAGDSASDN